MEQLKIEKTMLSKMFRFLQSPYAREGVFHRWEQTVHRWENGTIILEIIKF
jgi:hypothetical protein